MLCSAAIAHAEEPAVVEVGDITLRAERYTGRDDGPLLHLDYDPGAITDGPGAQTDGDASLIQIGRRTRMGAEGRWWKAAQTPKLPGPDVDELSRGWRASYALTYDLGWFVVSGSIRYGHVDGRDETGTYRTLGVSVSRTFRLSRWMRGWISLGVANQTWLGDGKQSWLGPDATEANPNGTTLMLSIGTTFR